MIKDIFLRILIIPLLGIVISYFAGIITYNNYPSAIGKTGAFAYFSLVSYCIWSGCHWLHLRLRVLFAIDVNPFTKIASLCLTSSIYGGVVTGLFCMIWMKFAHETFRWDPINKSIILSILAVVLFTLVYEVLYLSKERERDNIIVDQLDHELTRAEVAALRNELDPHFIYNSLNTLSYLITKNTAKADQFNNKLAQVYKYFLINKNKEQIALDKEIDFINNYIFLIQIRHENKIELHIDLAQENISNIYIIPYSLQLLIENAVMHNCFSIHQPLQIFITVKDEYLVIENLVNKRNLTIPTTKVGLRNLSSQYLLIFKKNIIIDETERKFIVKIPLIKKTPL